MSQVSVVDVLRRNRPVDVALKLEPSVIGVGGRFVAAGMNAQVRKTTEYFQLM
jgi:hypothetical protein